MAARNYEELGYNLQKIVYNLISNQKLLKLLYYTDKDPLSQPDLDDITKKNEIFNRLIKVVPRLGQKETEGAQSLIALRVVKANVDRINGEFSNIYLAVEVFVPLTQWFIKDENLRPFVIMGQIQKTLNGLKINGLGTINGGDFDLNFLTEEMSCYEMTFYITQYA